jgi:DNA polymerase III delta subunit
MKFTELKNDIAEGAKGIYLLEGDDAYFKTKAEEQIKTAFLQFPELNFTTFDANNYKGANLSEISAAAQSFPFMSEKRIIKITDLNPTDGDYEKYIQPMFENLPSSTILIIVNNPSKKGVDLKRKKCVTYVDCNKADEETVTKWAYLTLKRAGVPSSVEACQAIAAYCLCDMGRVSVEVEKLIALKSEQGITKALVDELIYKDADYRIYEMTNAVARKNNAAFCEILYDLLSKGNDENLILSALLSYFKNLLIIATSNSSDKELADMLKMKEYGVKKSGEQAQAIGRERLKNLVSGLYSLIADIKSGNLTPTGALDCAIAKVLFA